MELGGLIVRLADHVRDALVVTRLDPGDPERRPRIVWVNAAFTALTGYDRDELLGRGPGMLDGPATDPEALKRLRRDIREAGFGKVELVQYRKDGGTFEAEVEVQYVDGLGGDSGAEHWVVIMRDITEQNRLRADARRTNQLLEQVLELSGIGTWEIDVAEGFPRWDRTTKRLHEVEPDFQPDMETALDFYPPEARAQVQAAVQRAVEAGEPWEIESGFVTAKGNARWVRSAGKAEYGADGAPTRLFGFFEDITERRERERANEELSRRLDVALRAAKMGVWELEREIDVLNWDDATRELYGVKKTGGPLSFKDWAACMHPDDVVAATEAIGRAIGGGQEFNQLFRIILPDGQTRHVAGRGLVRTREDGMTVVTGVNWDVTHEVEARSALETLSSRLDIALSAAGAGVFEYDLSTGEVYWDGRDFEMHGWSDPGRPLSYEDWEQFVHPDDIAAAAEAVRVAAETRGVFDHRYRIIRKDGEERVVHGKALVKESARGRWVMTGVNWDVTEEVRVRRELEQRRVEAEAANLAKSRFLATMSHEIRTPLNGVLGMTQLLEMTGLDDKQRTYARTIRSSGESLLGLIDDVLDIAKIEAGKLELDERAFQLRGMIEAAADTVRAQALEKSLRLVLDVDASLPAWVMGDDKRVRQVLINLLGNAVKFTDEGGVTVSARAGDGDRIRFEVADTGPGVPSDQRAVIFERFAQADMSATRRHGGAGMGLAIAAELVGVAGGEIGVSDAPGGGAAFWFTWPLLAGARTCPASPQAAAQPFDGAAAGARVLVAEDNPVNAELMQQFLAEYGYAAEIVGDGEAALERLSQETFETVLLDLHMPGKSGEEVLKRLRESSGPNRDARVFILTADTSLGLSARLEAAGAERCFTKPLNLAELGLALDAPPRRAASIAGA